MDIINIRTFAVFFITVLYISNSYSQVSVYSRAKENGQYYNALITGDLSYSSGAVNVLDTSNKKEYEFVWSAVTEGRHLLACLPEPWSLATESQGVQVVASTSNESEDSDCKLLYFHSSQGFTRLKTKTAVVRNHPFQPTFSGADFTGVIALKPATERNSQVQGYSITSDAKPQNKTGHLPLPYDHPNPPLLFGSSSGHMGLDDPFDDRKPPFLFSPLAGSELVISPVFTPQSQHSFIRINILLLSGESFTSILSGDEALALKKANALTNPFQLLSYIRRRHHWLTSWFSQRENLESALENGDEANERYIQNLIDSLDDMKVMITPDNESIAVSGILNAMINGNPEKNGNNNGQGASGNGLRQRKSGGAGNNRNPAGNGESGSAEGASGGEGNGQHPDQAVKKTEGGGNELDIRSILNNSQFSELFNAVPDFILSSLYACGQLTTEQLMELLQYNTERREYNLSFPLTSDDLIEKLEQSNDKDKAISLSVLYHVAKTLGENNNLNLIHQHILSKTPSIWRGLVRKVPEIPNDNTPEEITRHLAKLLGFNGEKRVKLYNDMVRKGYIPIQAYRSSILNLYPVALFIIHHHKSDKPASKTVLEHIKDSVPNLVVNRRLTELLYGTKEKEVTEHTTKVSMQTKAPRQKQDLQKKYKVIMDFLKHQAITENTLSALNDSGLLDENRINKICIDDSNTINHSEIIKLLNDLKSYSHSLEALKQLGYSEDAINALKDNGNLYIDNCRLLEKAFDDNAAEVITEALTGKLKIFNSFLQTNRIKHPKLIDRLRTNDEWLKRDREQTTLNQHSEIIRRYGLETYVNMQARYIEGSETAALPLDENDINIRASQAIKAHATSHDYQYERLTGENLHLSITTAIKYMVNLRAKEIKRQKAERQRKIDEGRESWCEWLTRMIFG